jgi:hypothetical protein
MSYWDTSALAKLYLPEPDSADFVQKAASDALMATARLTLCEMRRVAFRKESEGFIPVGTAEAVLSQLEQDIAAGQIRLIEMDAPAEAEFNGVIAACYRRNPPLPIRTLDALHLGLRSRFRPNRTGWNRQTLARCGQAPRILPVSRVAGSPAQVSESSSVTARSMWLGFSIPYSTRSQSSDLCWICCWRR